jgi:arylsulfatase A-like enzyme
MRSLLCLSVFILTCGCSLVNPEVTDQQPNIVFIFTDDQTYRAVGALGNAQINTPHIDRIVEGGTSFTHAYNMGGWNGAICVASRAMMISGRSMWRARAFQEGWRAMDSVALSQTWGQLMESDGYDTYMTGKWHVQAPADSVFQVAKHIRPGMPGDRWNHGAMMEKMDSDDVSLSEVMPAGYNRPLDENDHSWSPTDSTFGGFWEGGQHWSEVVRDDAFDFIEQARGSEKPFFMYLAFNAPHDPRQAPQEYMDMYPIELMETPESWLPEYPYKDEIGCSQMLRDEALAPFPRTEFAVKTHLQEYFAIISHLDEQIGQILDRLEATGQMENTYMFFGSDHGLAVGRHGFLGKQNMYDHSMRVPLAVMGPGIPAGKRIHTDVYLQDIMATSLELAGIEIPDYVEFNSLLPLIHGDREESFYDGIYGAYIDLQRMIRKDDHKMIVYPKISRVRLYDLTSDPEELQDLSTSPQYRDKAVTLFSELLELQQEFDDPDQLGDLYEEWTTSEE